MEAMRVTWNDDRLSSLDRKVDTIHGEMKDEFKAVRTEMKDEFKAVRTEMKDEFKAVRTEMKDEFKTVRAEMKEGFAAVQRSIYTLMITLIVVLGGIVAAAQF
ncbi:MAG TPA: hypothetical protein VHQ43_06985 [Solirubrobacterales bacterium]|jgi:gas vesicle protein|nr:hypothetical protein [Solirubrobacterales bacterium]